jgi:hypothetical protein
VAGKPRPVLVVYLAYLPYGASQQEQFLVSYDEHDAGLKHDFLFVKKGTGFCLQHEGMELETVVAPNNCLDLGTYLWVAREIPAQRYLFLNTSSVILADQWLKKMDGHLKGKVGIVGASGSHGGSVDQTTPYPNPHMRTTAFMIERDLMLDLDWHEPIETKDDAYAAENGSRSITTQILERGLGAVVVGKDGKGYPVEQWKESDTFWINDQDNLLISDNGTQSYANNQSSRFRRKKTLSAWHPKLVW